MLEEEILKFLDAIKDHSDWVRLDDETWPFDYERGRGKLQHDPRKISFSEEMEKQGYIDLQVKHTPLVRITPRGLSFLQEHRGDTC